MMKTANPPGAPLIECLFSPVELHIDGTIEDGTLSSGEGSAPYWVFDANAQEQIAGPFRFKWAAELTKRRLERKQWADYRAGTSGKTVMNTEERKRHLGR